jgi:hypothetical protein
MELNICEQFFNNPKLHPLTHKKINKQDFNYYQQLCKKEGYRITQGKSYKWQPVKPPKYSLTNIKELDMEILNHLTTKDIDKLAINKYIQSIINDNYFWKQYLIENYGIESDKNFDFKSITKYIEEHYPLIAVYNAAIIDDNQVILELLMDNHFTYNSNHLIEVGMPNYILAQNAQYSYDRFMEYIEADEDYIENDDFLDRINYVDNKITVIYDVIGKQIRYTFANHITNGELLYNIAKTIKAYENEFIDDEDELTEYFNGLELVRPGVYKALFYLDE